MKDPFSFFSLTHHVYRDVFSHVCQKDQGFIAGFFSIQEEFTHTLWMQQSGLLDTFKYRAKRRSLKVAQYICNAKGDLNLKNVSMIIAAMESQGYIPTPLGYSDSSLLEHMLCVLKKIQADKNCQAMVKKFTLPLCHRWAEKIIKDTLGYPDSYTLTDRDVKVAALSACLYPLRQNVGSCFATAPAILIQKEQLENILTDFLDLLMTGKMVRTFGGVQHAVPLSPSVGVGDLRKGIQHLLTVDLQDIPFEIFIPLIEAGILDPSMERSDRKSWFYNKLSLFLKHIKVPNMEEFFQFVVFEYFLIQPEDMENYLLQERVILRHSKKVEMLDMGPSSGRRENFEKTRAALDRARRSFLCITENALLRAWEYTLASLSEVKMDFSRWNLYASLGLHHEESSGIGQIIYRFVEDKIASCNQRLEEYQRDYEIAHDQLRATETLLKKASSESEARRLKAEFETRSRHMQATLELRDRFYKKASFYPHLYSFILQKFDHMFPEFFQEIYDAMMQEVETHEYEDSPAGFRLVYKHGRRDASLWTMIHNEEQFIDALTDFFIFVEPELSAACDEKGCSEDIKDVISKIILHLRTEEFISSAFRRCVKGHSIKDRVSIDDIKKGEKKPWCYTSGGVMSTLIKTYYRRESELQEESFSVESSLDLLTLIVETMKGLNYNFTVYFPKDSPKRMLMYSPTHAFQLLPYEKEFFEAWDYSGFTYTWIRDKILLPRQSFYRSMTLSLSEQRYLIDSFSEYLPPKLVQDVQKYVNVTDFASVKEFAQLMLEALPKIAPLEDMLDSFLYQMLPLTPSYKWKDAVYSLLHTILPGDALDVMQKLPSLAEGYISAKQIKELAKAVFLLTQNTVSFGFDLHALIERHAESQGLSAPKPLIFADSNWSQNLFGFAVSPISEDLRLWRVSACGTEGVFMRSWLPFLSPGNTHTWGIYVRPQDYSAIFEKKI